jgi:hypothetical protein
MRSTIPKASADAGLETWRFMTSTNADGSIDVVVDRGAT